MKKMILTPKEWETIEKPLLLWMNEYLHKYCDTRPTRADVDYINLHKEKYFALKAFLKERIGAELEERRRAV